MAIGAEIGSDVPWFFAGGAAIAAGRGERVVAVGGLPELAAVIACPPTGLSTAAVYARCVPDTAHQGAAARLAAALATGGLESGLPLMTNDLEPAARGLSREIDSLLDALGSAGGRGPRLTGSGSACFALAATPDEADRVARRLAAMRPGGTPPCAAIFPVRVGLPEATTP